MGVDNCHGRLVLVLVNGIQGIQGKKCSKDISNKTMLTITIMLKTWLSIVAIHLSVMLF